MRFVPHSLRWRLTLLYVLLLALVLAGLGGYTYLSLRANLISVRVDNLADDVNVGRLVFNRLSPEPTAKQAPVKLATSIAIASGESAGVVIWSRSLSVDARVAGPSKNVSDLPLLDATDITTALKGNRSAPQVMSNSAGTWLVAAFPTRTRAHHLKTAAIQVSVPMQPIDEVLNRFTLLFAAGSFGVLVLAFLGGLWLTNRSLRPLRRLATTAGRLASGDLRARTNMERSDEVGVLGNAFDDMAGRIERAFALQQSSEEQVRRFIADASHELRTPITALKGYIDIMRRGAGRDPESMDSILDSMAREADRMRTLILDLLTLARLDARQSSPADQRFEINSLLNQVLDEGVPNMPEQLTRRVPDETILVRGDRAALQTVLRNVLVNACKYAPGAPQRWSLTAENGYATVIAEDLGPGIPAGDLPHIFERFYRGEKTRTRDEGGSGLGLSIVQGLMAAQGGSVGIESTEGKGTKVVLTLQRA